MRVTIRKKNFELTPALDTYIETKLLRPLRRLLANKIISEPSTVDFEFSRTTLHHRKGKVWRAEVVISLPKEKKPLYAEVTDEDIRAAIDLLAEEAEGEIKKYKGKFQARVRRSARAAKRELRFDPAAKLSRKGRVRNEGN